MFEIQIENMDLDQIAKSGQCFRMEKQPDGSYLVICARRLVQVRQEGKQFAFSCKEEEFKRDWRAYFDLDRDYGEILASVDPGDRYLREAADFGSGVRVLRQDLWEMAITFLISQNNNIKRIAGSIQALSARHGSRLKGRGFQGEVEYAAFPDACQISQGGLLGLQGLGLGYRDKYVLDMAQNCAKDPSWLQRLSQASYEEACQMLLARLGVGKKVADCVCLYGLHHVEAFPVDTHMKQILKAHYPGGFPLERYQGYGGILQQYMFYHKRFCKEKPPG